MRPRARARPRTAPGSRCRGWRSSRTRPEVDLAPQGHGQDLLGVPGPDDEPDARMALGEAHEQPGQDVGADRRGGAQDELAGPAAAEVAEQGRAFVEGDRRRARRRAGRPGRRRSGSCPRRPRDEERLAELRLERLEPGGEGRLRDVQRLGGPAQVALASDLEEGLDLRREHVVPATTGITSRWMASRHSIGLIRCDGLGFRHPPADEGAPTMSRPPSRPASPSISVTPSIRRARGSSGSAIRPVGRVELIAFDRPTASGVRPPR